MHEILNIEYWVLSMEHGTSRASIYGQCTMFTMCIGNVVTIIHVKHA